MFKMVYSVLLSGCQGDKRLLGGLGCCSVVA